MDKIKLSNNQKQILEDIKNGIDYTEEWDEGDLYTLKEEKLILDACSKDGDSWELSEKGIAYLRNNPNLENPSLKDDKRFVITTGISITALLVSVISLIIAWTK